VNIQNFLQLVQTVPAGTTLILELKKGGDKIEIRSYSIDSRHYQVSKLQTLQLDNSHFDIDILQYTHKIVVPLSAIINSASKIGSTSLQCMIFEHKTSNIMYFVVKADGDQAGQVEDYFMSYTDMEENEDGKVMVIRNHELSDFGDLHPDHVKRSEVKQVINCVYPAKFLKSFITNNQRRDIVLRFGDQQPMMMFSPCGDGQSFNSFILSPTDLEDLRDPEIECFQEE
jgi:hypothetical protein